MGLTKQYLAYHPVGNFNIVASGNANIVFVTYDKTDGRYVAVGAAEKVIIWDLRLGEKVVELERNKEEVTALRPSPDKLHLAVGFSDGVVRVFNLTASLIDDSTQYAVHRSAVNVLRYDALGKYHIPSGRWHVLDAALIAIIFRFCRYAIGKRRTGYRHCNH